MNMKLISATSIQILRSGFGSTAAVYIIQVSNATAAKVLILTAFNVSKVHRKIRRSVPVLPSSKLVLISFKCCVNTTLKRYDVGCHSSLPTTWARCPFQTYFQTPVFCRNPPRASVPQCSYELNLLKTPCPGKARQILPPFTSATSCQKSTSPTVPRTTAVAGAKGGAKGQEISAHDASRRNLHVLVPQ